MEKYCFLNGKIMPLSEAKVGVEDIGLLRGYGIYDGLAVFKGKVFHFADHWNRLLSGAHILNLNVPVTEEKAERVIEELAMKNGFMERANVRIILTGGKTLGGIEYDFAEPTFYILVEKWDPLPQELYEKGGKLVTYRHMRGLAEYKTTNYIRAVNLQNWRKEEKAIEILYVYDGEVLECATSNIFVVKDKTLITPTEDILKGITRKVILKLAEGKYKVEERPILEEELKTADEVFISSSFKDIVPIVKVDDFTVGDGQVGEITKDLMAKFKAYISVPE
ncbi:MAG: aminotransferase class IV [Candidatus Paceibacterota bacterium]|jgi:D-amino acid aminotransferase